MMGILFTNKNIYVASKEGITTANILFFLYKRETVVGIPTASIDFPSK